MQRDPQLLITFGEFLVCGLFAALTLAFVSPGTRCLMDVAGCPSAPQLLAD